MFSTLTSSDRRIGELLAADAGFVHQSPFRHREYRHAVAVSPNRLDIILSDTGGSRRARGAHLCPGSRDYRYGGRIGPQFEVAGAVPAQAAASTPRNKVRRFVSRISLRIATSPMRSAGEPGGSWPLPAAESALGINTRYPPLNDRLSPSRSRSPRKR
jgi:hypothetical protein